MCTSLLSAWEGEAEDVGQRVSLAVVAVLAHARLVAFAAERGWRRLRLYSDLTGAFSRDYHALVPGKDGGLGDDPAFTVFTRRDGVIRLFWAGEMGAESVDPGQDPRGAPDLMPLLDDDPQLDPRGTRPRLVSQAQLRT